MRSQRRRARRGDERVGRAFVRVDIPIRRRLFQNADEMHRAIAIGRGCGRQRSCVVVVEFDDADRARRCASSTRRAAAERTVAVICTSRREPRDQSPTQVAVRAGDQYAHDWALSML